MTAAALPLTEAQFQAQVTAYAELCGWEWVHCRAGRTVDSWRTPMSGTMAKGFPDLVLVHPEQRRLIFAELKTDTGKLTPDQERVLAVLRNLEWPWWMARDSEWTIHPDSVLTSSNTITTYSPRIAVHVWRPSHWAAIEEALR